MKKLLFVWKQLNTTFWFLPTFIICLSIVLVIFILRLDEVITISTDGLGRFFFVNSIESARSLLTTIAGAMIGVAGTVFSITLVALSLTTSQLGSRQIRNFMYHKLNQFVLGSYISTFVCCVIILNVVNKFDNGIFIPHLTILFATVLSIANIILLIFFIHNVAVSIQANSVVAEISKELSDNLNTMFPESFGDETNKTLSEESLEDTKLNYPIKHDLILGSSGYLQYMDNEKLLSKAEKLDVILQIDCRPGNYMVQGVKAGLIYSKEILSEKQLQQFQTFFITGNTRTSEQDAEHSIHQLVEIASRALSPGINDPYTAIACIDNLTKSMVFLSSVDFPSKYRLDKNNNLRAIIHNLSFESMLDAAFNQIRQFSKDSPSVVIRLMDALTTINKFVKLKEQKEAVKKHAIMVLNLGKNRFDEPNDFKDLEKRAKSILD
ncbi:putative membrane protein [Winogradskyella wandonensis]|uniref:Putative membrane protein n=1 Tax=Winogradskyella wandonensis TaxID=1442586 RepID=A0A4V6NEP2_9FLAO|nr:DUF2254 domain-containing protein [Winogradskyella wandonensis]TCK68991.1 putative membrane protein [Winogradskyella wandonensis]